MDPSYFGRKRKLWYTFHTVFEDVKKDEIFFLISFGWHTFLKVLEIVHNKLRRGDTNMRLSVAPAKRLAVTIRYVWTIYIFLVLKIKNFLET